MNINNIILITMEITISNLAFLLLLNVLYFFYEAYKERVFNFIHNGMESLGNTIKLGEDVKFSDLLATVLGLFFMILYSSLVIFLAVVLFNFIFN